MEIYKILLLVVWLYLIISTVLSYKRSGLSLDDYVFDRDLEQFFGFLIKLLYIILWLTVYFLQVAIKQIDWSWLFIKV